MIDDTTFLEYGKEMIVIREIFDGAQELFENELERAFEFGCPTIVIEPCRLGEETARWIFFGEYLTRYSIVTGLGSIVTGFMWPEKIFIQCSLLGTALLTHGIHLVSWQQDICSYYRVERNPEQFLKIMADTRSTQRFEDNISLLTSTEYPRSPSIETEEEYKDEKVVEDSEQKKHQPPHQQTNPYEIILNTSARKQKSPVVLCRRTSQEIKRSHLINAAVSLLAIAFSFIRFVRSSFLSSSSTIISKWSFLKNFTLI